jgi:ABC-type nitrate/sulfonate/bicarbonate transport system substrate-binding protein
MSRFSRRGVLSASLAGIVGAVVGGVGGYSLRQPEVREAVRTLTQTVTRAVTETRLQTDVRTVTQTATMTVGGRSPPPKDKITVASASDAFSLQVLQQQHATELFKAMGYNAEHSLLGVRGSTTAFTAKQAQIWIGSSDEIMPVIEQGEDVIFVGGSSSLAYYVVSTADINSLKDFEGKPFGISRIGAVSHTIPVYMMQQAGVDINKVQWVAVGGSGARAQALLAGRIVGGILIADIAWNTVKQSGGKLKLLATVADVAPGRILDQQPIAVYRDWAEKNPQVVMDFLRAKIMSDAWAAVNSEEYIRMAAERAFGKVEQEGLDLYTAVYDLYRSKGYLPFFMDVKSLPIQVRLAKEAGSITKDLDWRKVYEPKYLNAVIKNLSEYIPKAV